MKKIFTLLFALTATIGTTFAWDYTQVQIDGFSYNLDATNLTAETTNSNNYYSGDLVIPSFVKYNDVTYRVVGIGDYSFQVRALTSVVIPEGVTYIGIYAFGGSSFLSSVSLPESLISIGINAFYNCYSLTSVTIPNSVTFIARKAFFYVPNVVYSGTATWENLQDNVWWGARSLNGHVDGYLVYSDETKTNLLACSAAAKGEITIPNSVTNIEQRAFGYCTALTNISLGNSIQTIGYAAFAHCSKLSEITLPNTITSIGEHAFSECSSLTRATLPNRLTRIEAGVFYICRNLKTITIPETVTSIGHQAFYKCEELTSLVLPKNVASLDYWVFMDCTGLKSITCYAVKPPVCINSDPFYNVDHSIPVYVRARSLVEYQEAIWWHAFTNYQALPTTYYTVTFQDWNGTELKSEKVEEDFDATAPEDPSREGHTFIGWDKEFTNVTENLIVTAQYEINRYHVEFRDWNNTLLKEEDVEYQSPASAPADPSRDWYTFIGWDKDFTNITEDIVVTAQYKEGRTIDYSLLFTQSTDNSEISEGLVSIKFPVPPTISGFTFLKWMIVGGDLENTIEIQAIYEADEPTSAPETYTNPTNSAQKLIRNGNVYILTEGYTYTIDGRLAK